MENKPDKLKEIRDKYKSYITYLDDVEIGIPYPILNTIQSETYQLGREDVIGEIEEYIEVNIYNSSDVKNIKIIPKNLFMEKLEKLKESK